VKRDHSSRPDVPASRTQKINRRRLVNQHKTANHCIELLRRRKVLNPNRIKINPKPPLASTCLGPLNRLRRLINPNHTTRRPYHLCGKQRNVARPAAQIQNP
jgi:hypothetical protein